MKRIERVCVRVENKIAWNSIFCCVFRFALPHSQQNIPRMLAQACITGFENDNPYKELKVVQTEDPKQVASATIIQYVFAYSNAVIFSLAKLIEIELTN